MMTIEDLKDFIIQNFAEINLVEANGDLFFMHNQGDKKIRDLLVDHPLIGF